MKTLSACRLYTFIDTAYLHGRAPAAIADQLCFGGSDIIQLRAKGSTPDEILRIAEEVLPIVRKAGARLVINDHPDIAKKVGADLCHLGQEDFFDAGFSKAAEVAGESKLGIGVSTHAPEQAARAVEAGPDYIAIGPIYPTGTKPTAKAVTLEYVRWAAANVMIPWFAIGGINLRNIDEVLDAGATRICVVSAILNASDITGACQEYRKRLDAR